MNTPVVKIGYNTINSGQPAQNGQRGKARGGPQRPVEIYLNRELIDTLPVKTITRFSRFAADQLADARAKTGSTAASRLKLHLSWEERVSTPAAAAFKFAFAWMREAAATPGSDLPISYGPPELNRLSHAEMIDIYAAGVWLQIRPAQTDNRNAVIAQFTGRPLGLADLGQAHEMLPAKDPLVEKMLLTHLTYKFSDAKYAATNAKHIENYIYRDHPDFLPLRRQFGRIKRLQKDQVQKEQHQARLERLQVAAEALKLTAHQRNRAPQPRGAAQPKPGPRAAEKNPGGQAPSQAQAPSQVQAPSHVQAPSQVQAPAEREPGAGRA